MEENYWTMTCKRCGIGTNTDYCHDCDVTGAAKKHEDELKQKTSN